MACPPAQRGRPKIGDVRDHEGRRLSDDSIRKSTQRHIQEDCSHVSTVHSAHQDSLDSVDACWRPCGKTYTGMGNTVADRGTASWQGQQSTSSILWEHLLRNGLGVPANWSPHLKVPPFGIPPIFRRRRISRKLAIAFSKYLLAKPGAPYDSIDHFARYNAPANARLNAPTQGVEAPSLTRCYSLWRRTEHRAVVQTSRQGLPTPREGVYRLRNGR